jgi:hypothetical protein
MLEQGHTRRRKALSLASDRPDTDQDHFASGKVQIETVEVSERCCS